VADVDAARGQATASSLAIPGTFERTDVTDLASVQAAVAAAVQRFGRLDVMVNCAGLGLVGTVQETTSDDWQRLMAVNVTGVFHGSRAAVDQFLCQQPPGGVIVNIASVAGQIGVPSRFAYCATKGAVIAMTKQLAVDYVQRGIRCNAICPGTIYTPPALPSWVWRTQMSKDRPYSGTRRSPSRNAGRTWSPGPRLTGSTAAPLDARVDADQGIEVRTNDDTIFDGRPGHDRLQARVGFGLLARPAGF
jgi:NAD(P)-dependent dehydrogenase (short-subunit alcohol dehydrogenase family)